MHTYTDISMSLSLYVYIYIYIIIIVANVSNGSIALVVMKLFHLFGRLTTIMWCDDCWQFSNQVIVFWDTFTQKQSPDRKHDWQQSHHMMVLTFRLSVCFVHHYVDNAASEALGGCSAGKYSKRTEYSAKGGAVGGGCSGLGQHYVIKQPII